MQALRIGAVGTILAALLAGCGGNESVTTTMPTTAPKMPPEADQMKKEFEKGLKSNFAGTTAPSSNSAK